MTIKRSDYSDQKLYDVNKAAASGDPEAIYILREIYSGEGWRSDDEFRAIAAMNSSGYRPMSDQEYAEQKAYYEKVSKESNDSYQDDKNHTIRNFLILVGIGVLIVLWIKWDNYQECLQIFTKTKDIMCSFL